MRIMRRATEISLFVQYAHVSVFEILSEMIFSEITARYS